MKPKTVLVVDDEEDIRFFLVMILEDEGYRALSASGVREGFERIRAERPDLVCLDILMPEESGISAYHKLKSDPELADLPVIFTSGMSFNRELKGIDYLEGPDGQRLPEPEGMLEKPIDGEAFIALVGRVLSKGDDHDGT